MSLFAGCGGSGSAATGTDAGSTDASGDAEAVTETAASGEGSVYWLNFKPELDETIQELGKKYTYTLIFGNGTGGYDENGDPLTNLVPITYTVSAAEDWTPVDGGEVAF